VRTSWCFDAKTGALIFSSVVLGCYTNAVITVVKVHKSLVRSAEGRSQRDGAALAAAGPDGMGCPLQQALYSHVLQDFNPVTLQLIALFQWRWLPSRAGTEQAAAAVGSSCTGLVLLLITLHIAPHMPSAYK
jgi:hypothetical protein